MTYSILTVSPDQQYHSIAAAISAANNTYGGVVIGVTSRTYVNEGGTISNNNVAIEAVGGVTKLVGTCSGRGSAAALTARGINVFLANSDIPGVAKGAGFVNASGNITVDSVRLHDNQVGLAAIGNTDGVLTVLDSEVDHNGTNSAIGAITSLEIVSSSIHDARSGAEVSSLAQHSFIFDAIFADHASNAAYAIDLPNKTYLSVAVAIIEKGRNSGRQAARRRNLVQPKHRGQ